MKKYFFKIIPAFLVIATFLMASGLCSQNFSASMLMTKAAVAATSSLLPCCVDSAHPGLTVISQSVTFDKSAAVAIFTQTVSLSENLKTINYHNPIISPPELSMVKATVLRL